MFRIDWFAAKCVKSLRQNLLRKAEFMVQAARGISHMSIDPLSKRYFPRNSPDILKPVAFFSTLTSGLHIACHILKARVVEIMVCIVPFSNGVVEF